MQGSTAGKQPCVLIIPGFADTAVGPHNLHVQLATRLAQAGYAVLRFDYRGLGESDGDFRTFTLKSGMEDVKGALDALHAMEGIDKERTGVVGFSLGGAYAAELAALSPQVRALGLLAPIAYPAPVLNTFFNEEHRAQLKQRDWIDWQGWAVGAHFIENLDTIDPLAAFQQAGIPSLVIHGTQDSEVSIFNAHAYRTLGAKLMELEGADHPFGAVAYKEKIFNHLLEWFSSNL